MPAKKTSAVRAWGRGAAGSGLTGSECTRTSSATRAGGEDGGGNRARTGDLLAASQTLSQLSYTPTERVPTCAGRHGSIAQACLPATARTVPGATIKVRAAAWARPRRRSLPQLRAHRRGGALPAHAGVQRPPPDGLGRLWPAGRELRHQDGRS